MVLVNYDNEFMRLKSLALYRPIKREIGQKDPESLMYRKIPDPVLVQKEFDDIVTRLEDLGINVVVLNAKSNKESVVTPNMIYLRDTAFVYGQKILLANMKHPIRRAEPEKLKALLENYNTEYEQYIVDVLSGDAKLEGADILVLENGLAAYTGNRTSSTAIPVIKKLFNNVDVMDAPANISGIPQHLLGGIHIIGPGLAIRRTHYCNSPIQNLDFIDFDEDTEISGGLSLNIITIGPSEILMPANRPKTRARLEAAGIRCHTVEINEIHKMGGGLACMALPLERELLC